MATAGSQQPAAALVVASDQPERLGALLRQSASQLRLVSTDDSLGQVTHSKQAMAAARAGNAPNPIGAQELLYGAFLRSWVDFFLLSEASSAVFMHSGFSRIACSTSLARARAGGQCFETPIGSPVAVCEANANV